MRKAFDANVPKLKPRLKGVPVVVSPEGAFAEEEALPAAMVSDSVAATAPEMVSDVGSAPGINPVPDAVSATVPEQSSLSENEVEEETPPIALDAHPDPLPPQPGEEKKEVFAMPGSRVAAPRRPPETPVVVPEPAVVADLLSDLDVRRERLEKIKRKVAEAARTGARLEPVPEEPARAAESVLGLVHDLEVQLNRARDLEEALRGDLAQAKGELARAVTEGRTAAEKLVQAETQVDEKRQVLEEMLAEMSALEEERDQAVRRAQALATLDEERQKLLDELGRHAAETEKALAESRAEGDRLSAELDARIAENARLRAGLTEVTRERDTLAREAEQVTRERDELLEAKHALEQVHQALSQARARLGP